MILTPPIISLLLGLLVEASVCRFEVLFVFVRLTRLFANASLNVL